jgi:hypothetical protein
MTDRVVPTLQRAAARSGNGHEKLIQSYQRRRRCSHREQDREDRSHGRRERSDTDSSLLELLWQRNSDHHLLQQPPHETHFLCDGEDDASEDTGCNIALALGHSEAEASSHSHTTTCLDEDNSSSPHIDNRNDQQEEVEEEEQVEDENESSMKGQGQWRRGIDNLTALDDDKRKKDSN